MEDLEPLKGSEKGKRGPPIQTEKTTNPFSPQGSSGRVAKPVVLAAWEPEYPEEALSAHETLGRLATVQFEHELTQELRNDLLRDVEVLLVMGWPRWVTEELPRMRKLRLVQRFLSGVESLPFEALARRKPPVKVAGGAGWNADLVADHAWGLVLACAKRIVQKDAQMRRGLFPQLEAPSLDLRGRTLGVLGYGEVGSRVAQLGRAFGMQVQALRRTRPFRAPVVGDLRKLPHLLETSDVVIVALPLTKATEGILDKAMLQRMKPSAILVNLARGAIIDEEALYHRLALHREFYAGLDVWWEYPKGDAPFAPRLPFAELPNVVMSPHTAAMTPDWRARAVRFGCQNVARFLRGKTPQNLVRLRDYL